MTNIGIIGLGLMGTTHLRIYRQMQRAAVVAVCDPDSRRMAGDFSEKHGGSANATGFSLDMTGIKAAGRPHELIEESSVGAVDICTPTPTHHEFALKAMAAGKHVICQKPLARTSSEAAALVDEAKRCGRQLHVCMSVRFHPAYRFLRDAVRDERFGSPRTARFFRRSGPPSWGRPFYLNGDLSGGALLDLHIHDADFVRWCFGRPVSLQAAGRSLLSGAVDHVVALYHYDAGFFVELAGGWSAPPGAVFRAGYQVGFAEATLDYDSERKDAPLLIHRSGRVPETIDCAGPDLYHAQLAHFVDALARGETSPIIPPADAVEAIRMCELAAQAIRERSEVKL